MFDPDAPPAVVGVTLGLTGVQAIDFADKVGSGEQIRSIPLIAANTVNITFSRDVSVTQNEFQLVNLDGSSPTVFDFHLRLRSQTATWMFTPRWLTAATSSAFRTRSNALKARRSTASF